MCFTPAAATRRYISCASSAVRASGFSQMTCLPASAAAIVGSAWREFGPELSKSCTAGSATSSRQSVVERSNPYRSAASTIASSDRPAIETSRGRSGGGHVM